MLLALELNPKVSCLDLLRGFMYIPSVRLCPVLQYLVGASFEGSLYDY